MKNSLIRHILHLCLGAVLLMGGGCVMDHYDDPDPVASPASTVGYMSVKLMTDDGSTRAGVGSEYDSGLNSEYLLSDEAKHYAIFYTEGQEEPIAVASLGAMTADIHPDATANSSVVFATIAARNEQKETLQLLHNCYILLNSELEETELWNCTAERLLQLTESSPFFTDSKGKRFFKMSNSVYLEGNKKAIYTAVDTDKIFSSYQEAMEEAWKGNAAVNAYVERLNAKFHLKFLRSDYNEAGADRVFEPSDNGIIVFTHLNDNNIPYYSDGNDQGKYKYKIRITGWGMNALEKETYLFRNFDPQKSYFTGWSNPGNKRVFWSEDINYKKAVYPWQYRKVIDNSGIPFYQSNNNILENYSYEQLNVNKFDLPYLYAPENTYDFSDASFMKSLDSRAPLVAGTHMVVCAELLTNVGDDINSFHTNDIYRDRNGHFYLSEKECFNALVATMNNVLQSHSALKFTYWDWDKGGQEMKLFVRTKGSYSLYYDGVKMTQANIDRIYSMMEKDGRLTSPAEFKGSDGKRIIWPAKGFTIQDDQGNQLQTYSNIDEVDSSKDHWLREATINDLKSVIFEHVGAIDHFKDGKMYYSVPIGLVQDGIDATGDTAFSVYGVVRNASYEIEIQDVKGLGQSVDDPDQPIVGAQTSTSDKLQIGFEILDWHRTEQNVPGTIK